MLERSGLVCVRGGRRNEEGRKEKPGKVFGEGTADAVGERGGGEPVLGRSSWLFIESQGFGLCLPIDPRSTEFSHLIDSQHVPHLRNPSRLARQFSYALHFPHLHPLTRFDRDDRHVRGWPALRPSSVSGPRPFASLARACFLAVVIRSSSRARHRGSKLALTVDVCDR